MNPLVWLQQSATGYGSGLGLSALWGGIILSFAVTGMGALVWLTRLPPPPNCDRLSSFAADVDILYCAERSAESGELADLQQGLDIVTQWTPDHPMYLEAQDLLQRWSGTLLLLAQDQLTAGHLDQAIATAELVPPTSDHAQEAQAAIAQWRTEWEQGQTFVQAAETAIAQRQWPAAHTALKSLRQLDNNYWVSYQGGRIQTILNREQQAFTTLAEARKLAESGEPDDIGEAIALGQTISWDSEVWQEAKPEVDAWSKQLLDLAFKHWEEGEPEAAIAVAQQVPADPALSQDAQDLIQISYAESIAKVDQDWVPSYRQIFQLQEAIAALKTLPPTSSFHDRAQTYLTQWQADLQDLMQLQYAHLLAMTGTRQTYALAISQAALVAPDRPRREQAQTLLAHWQNEIERLEDQPILDRAIATAQPQTIASYKAAMQIAQTIELGRSLRVDAQTHIAMWQQNIEVLEDQPILDAALKLASGGNLSGAIAKAQEIDSGRALYADAREQINGWQAQIYLAQDRKIMTEANILAGRGSLSAAIDVASQIGSGRPLYSEARNSIAIWDRERQAVWDTWAEDETDSYSEPTDYGTDDGYDDGYYDYYDDSY